MAKTEPNIAALWSEIAQLTGFFDQSHLTNSFRRQYGAPPLRYRSALRDDVTRR